MFKAILFLFSVPLLIMYGTWSWAIVFKSVVNWLVVPTFFIAPVNFVQAIAISAMFNILYTMTYIASYMIKPKGVESDNSRNIMTVIMAAVCAPWVTWVGYWFVKTIFI